MSSTLVCVGAYLLEKSKIHLFVCSLSKKRKKGNKLCSSSNIDEERTLYSTLCNVENAIPSSVLLYYIQYVILCVDSPFWISGWQLLSFTSIWFTPLHCSCRVIADHGRFNCCTAVSVLKEISGDDARSKSV